MTDDLKTQIDRRKIEKAMTDNFLTLSDIENAEIVSVSECCGEDMKEDGTILVCTGCGGVIDE